MITFLKAAFGNMQQTGSVVESSKHLSKCMTRKINFKRKVNIVELGAGTGCITKHLLAEMCPASTLKAFEINDLLFTSLDNVDDKRLTKINDNVLRLQDYVEKRSVDYIVSGIPLANMANDEKTALINTCRKALVPDGYFIQFQYSLMDIHLLKTMFPFVTCGFTLLNLPPAFIYYAKN